MSPETAVETTRGLSDRRATARHRSPLGDFLGGAALIFDFVGTSAGRHISTVHHPTDADALAADWDAVGNDLRWAMHCHPSDQPPS